MGDLRETGIWLALLGFAATFVWNVLQYMRQPAFVRRSRLDEVIETVAELRVEISSLRTENADLKSQVRKLMIECEMWRDQYLAQRDRRAGGE